MWVSREAQGTHGDYTSPMPAAPAAPLRSLPATIPWLLLSGLALLAIAGIVAVAEHLHHRHELRTTGTVTEVTQTLAPDGSIAYATHIRFLTASGALTTIALKPTTSQEFKPGDTPAILYPPHNPQAAELGSNLSVYPIAIAIGGVGIALFDAGIAYWLFLRRGGVDRIKRDTKNLRESVRRT